MPALLLVLASPGGIGGSYLADAEAPGAQPEPRHQPRVRAGRPKPARPSAPRHHYGLLVLIIFGLLCLGVLAAGLITASHTIFAVGRGAAVTRPSGTGSPSPEAQSSLVGKSLDGSVWAVSVAQNEIAIEPAGMSAVEAAITSKSVVTVAGAASSIASLIPGDSVIVTFTQGPGGSLQVATLQDIQSVPTNTPNPTPNLYPYHPYNASPGSNTGAPTPIPSH